MRKSSKECNMKKYLTLVVVSLLVPTLIYFMGSGYSASFNLAEWSRLTREVAVWVWGIAQIMVVIFPGGL